MRRTKENAELTREAILDAAEQVFYEQGVSGGTLEEIARVAGVTRGAVYWHFVNKLAIFLALGERAVLPHEDAFRQMQQSSGNDPLTTLQQCFVSNFRSYGADRRAYVRLTVVMLRCDYVGDMAGARDGHAAVATRLSTSIERYFRDRMAPGREAASWEPEVLGRTLFEIVHGAIMLWLRDPVAFPLEITGVDGVRTFVGMVRSQWQPRPRCVP